MTATPRTDAIVHAGFSVETTLSRMTNLARYLETENAKLRAALKSAIAYLDEDFSQSGAAIYHQCNRALQDQPPHHPPMPPPLSLQWIVYDQASLPDPRYVGRLFIVWVDWRAVNPHLTAMAAAHAKISKWSGECWLCQDDEGEWSGPVKAVTHWASL